MDIDEYAKQSRLTRKILYWMVGKNMLNNPLKNEDLTGLRLLEKAWAKHEVIRAMLAHYPKNRRLRLLEGSQFNTKWERYAYGRYRNSLEKSERLKMKVLIQEIETTFGFTLKYHEIKKLYKVREKAYNHQKGAKKTAVKTGSKVGVRNHI